MNTATNNCSSSSAAIHRGPSSTRTLGPSVSIRTELAPQITAASTSSNTYACGSASRCSRSFRRASTVSIVNPPVSTSSPPASSSASREPATPLGDSLVSSTPPTARVYTCALLGCTGSCGTLSSMAHEGPTSPSFDLVIRGGMVVDGTGSPRARADVGVSNGKIAAIDLGLPAGRNEIDATGKLVTPGFVDIHTHY